MPEGLIPYFDLGYRPLTFTASAAVTKGRLVEITGNRTVGPAAAGSLKVAGVALKDAAINELVDVADVGVWPLTAGGAIAAGDRLQSGALGVVVVAAAVDVAGSFDPRAIIGQALEAIANGVAGRCKLGGIL